MSTWVLVFILSTYRGGQAATQVDGFKSYAACHDAQVELFRVKPALDSATILAAVCLERK